MFAVINVVQNLHIATSTGGRIVLARRKRKNFEARLKGRIMKNLEGWAEMQDCTKRMIRVYTNLLDASSFNSMCGQDVEGS